MGWLIALGILAGLSILPLGISVLYNTHGPRVVLVIGPVRLVVFSGKKKADKPKKKSGEKKPAVEKPNKKDEVGGKLTDFLPLVRTALEFLADFRRKLRVNRLEMKLILAGDDPCDLAVNYGRAWTALGNLMPHLERLLVIKKRDLEVECDFASNETLVTARLDLTITLGRLLALVVRYGIRAVRQYWNIMKLRKGGAKI